MSRGYTTKIVSGGNGISYDFHNIKTGEYFSKVMTLSEKEKYLKENKDIEQVLTKLNYKIRGMTLKDPGGFTEVLDRIHNNTPGSTIKDNATLLKNLKEV